MDMDKQMGKGEANSEMVMISITVSENLIVSLLRGQRKKSFFLFFHKGLDVNKIIRVMM